MSSVSKWLTTNSFTHLYNFNNKFNKGDIVICVRNNVGENTLAKYHITINKAYEVITSDVSTVIINDQGDICFYHNSYFITLAEFRNNRINEILNDE